MAGKTLFGHLPDTIPFERESANRYVPWVAAFIMYIALLSTFMAILLFAILDYWNPDATHKLTLEIPFSQKSSYFKGRQDSFTEEKIAKIINVLSESKGVVQVSLLSEKEMHKLLEPWFGKDFDAYDVPLPILMDVKVDGAKSGFQTEAVLSRIRKIAPEAQFIDSRSWRAVVDRFSFKIQFFIAGLVVLILGVSTWTITFATRTNLLMQRDVIELLTLLGATDEYIAQRFQKGTMAMAIESLSKALVGIFLTGGIMWWIAHDIDQQVLAQIVWHLISWKIVFLVLTPVLIMFLMVFSARHSVLRTLEELF